ncbi:RagB/SusD family nutrient uptake outer membrane protein [Gelidibacter mesophilus]|uniref:RagB/SusD family nutrient uptake outer membrane protein n=1 Tax=Gelidibacter mesophilus TaxID=169050 RepID=UPI0003F85F23|nr:RagB/SusD family nutrient uptake outer membrane protein [Gelidibacter mesophilus]
MKILKIILGILLIASFNVSCSDEAFLEEDLRDRFTTENAFLNVAQFQTGLNQMYRQTRAYFNSADGARDFIKNGYGVDVMASNTRLEKSESFWNNLGSHSQFPNDWYSRNYQMIKNCNELLLQTENTNIEWKNENQKLEIQAEIRFFRGFSYRNLATLFGGVPIVLEPVTAPKLDFERATRIETYQVALEDLIFASQYMPKTTDQPGRAVRAAADHFLSEVYISLGDETGDKTLYQNAIDAASRVIEGSDGDYSLMQNRFGTRSNESGKDAYWDLFRMGNQNYHDGNKESIWTIQFEKNVAGGTNIYDRPLFERTFWPLYYRANKFGFTSGPAKDWEGKGNAWIKPNNYYKYDVWKNSETDTRNAEYNILRNYRAPKVAVNGQQTDRDTTYVTKVTLANGSEITVNLKPGDIIKKEWLTTRDDTLSYFFPRMFKMGTDKHIDAIPDNGYVRDAYVIRLPETYLLRAEAYMKSENRAAAAEDINTVRKRSSASPITAGEVNINYILDERARELWGEEWRIFTLARLGLIYERTKEFGWPSDKEAVEMHHNLFPIPQSAIDANLEGTIEQNPGY